MVKLVWGRGETLGIDVDGVPVGSTVCVCRNLKDERGSELARSLKEVDDADGSRGVSRW